MRLFGILNIREREDTVMKKRKGSYTVEAVIVMSTLIFIIFAIISAFLLLYQNAVMYYVATQAAQEGAVMWTDTAQDLEGGIQGTDDQGLYYRIGELFGGGSEKEKEIQTWAEQKLRELTPNTLIGSGKETVSVSFHNYVVQQVVEVSITKEIDIPFGEIARYFDQDLDMHVTAKAAVAQPAEFIRNVDYGIELAKTVWKQISGALDGLLKSKK